MEARYGRGGSEELLESENLEAWGWDPGGSFEEGGSIPPGCHAFIFLPPYICFSSRRLSSLATVWETFTPNKYLLGFFSRPVPGNVVPFVTLSNRGLGFRFIPADFSLI